MANITITIPNDKVAEVVETLCANKPEDSELTDNQWAKQRIINFVKNEYKEYKYRQAIANETSDVDIT